MVFYIIQFFKQEKKEKEKEKKKGILIFKEKAIYQP